MRHGRRMGFSFGVLALIAIAASCREPTQMTLRITTGEKCSDLTGVQIVVGPSADVTQSRFTQHFAAALTHACVANGGGNVIGTLVVTPGESSGTVVVSAGVSQGGAQGPEPAACADPANAGKCIIARRSFSFIEHTSLTLPIDLDPLCVGKACDPASTCFKGGCVPDTVGCTDGTCGLPQETGTGSGSDASSSDGAYDQDGTDLGDAIVTGIDSGEDGGASGDAGAVIKDAAPDTKALDANVPSCGFMNMTYCSSGSGYITPDMTCDGGQNGTVSCCTCLCQKSSMPVACELASPGNSCHPSCP